MAHVLAGLFDSAIRSVVADILEYEGHEVTVPRDFWGGLGVLRSALHPLIVLYMRDGSPGLLTDEHLAAIEANMPSLRHHQYIQLTWGYGPWSEPFQRLVDQVHIQAVPGTFPIEVLLEAVDQAAARLTERST